MTLILNINRLGTKQITIDPSNDLEGKDHDTDGKKVVQAIQNGVRGLGTADAYQKFTCEYLGKEKFRFKLVTPAEVPLSFTP